MKGGLIKIVCALALSLSVVAHADDDPRYRLVSEYIRHISNLHDLQGAAATELNKSKGGTDQIMIAINASTRIKLELGAAIASLKSIKLASPLDSVPPQFIEIYQRKIELHDQLIEVSSQFVGGPKPGVDYGKLSTLMPQIRGNLEYLDETLFKVTPMLCFALYDDKSLDSAGNINRFILTRQQRKEILGRIERTYGKELDDKHPPYLTGSAWLLKTCLNKPLKSSDDK